MKHMEMFWKPKTRHFIMKIKLISKRENEKGLREKKFLPKTGNNFKD